jgi:hypothetical protein
LPMWTTTYGPRSLPRSARDSTYLVQTTPLLEDPPDSVEIAAVGLAVLRELWSGPAGISPREGSSCAASMLMTSAFRGQKPRSSRHTERASRRWLKKLLPLVIGRPPAVAADIPAGDSGIGFGSKSNTVLHHTVRSPPKRSTCAYAKRLTPANSDHLHRNQCASQKRHTPKSASIDSVAESCHLTNAMIASGNEAAGGRSHRGLGTAFGA